MTNKKDELRADDAEEKQESKNLKFQNACRIWFCPTDERIASELRQMQQEEREKVWADLSGNEKTSQFRKDVVEDMKIITSALETMKREIEACETKPAFELAQQQNPDYVNSESFLLMFLRSTYYDGRTAALKIVEHMETKKKLFGEDKLGRDIQLSDLSENDLNCLTSGGFQLLEQRDSAGRLILYGHQKSLKYKYRENKCRVLFYMLMSALRDEDNQKLGVVVVRSIMMEYTRGYDYEADRMTIQTLTSVPYRPVARYIVYQNPLWDQVLGVIYHFLSAHSRARTRGIRGTQEEVLYSLSCLGISRDSIPIDSRGELVRDQLDHWLEGRKSAESTRCRTESLSSLPEQKRRRLSLAMAV